LAFFANISSKMKEKIVGSYTSFGKLKKALVGTFQPLNYFDGLPTGHFKERMERIMRETHEDRDKLVKILKDHNVDVYETVNHFPEPQVASNGITSVINPRPPITPRDNTDFIDNKMFSFYTTNQPNRYFDDYAHHELFMDFFKQGAEWHQMPKGYHQTDIEDKVHWLEFPGDHHPYMDASNCIKLGKDIFYTLLYTANDLGIRWFKSILGEKFHFHELMDKQRWVDHVDAMIKIVRPGLVLSKYKKDMVIKVMPQLENWDFIFVPQDHKGIKQYFEDHDTTEGKWWWQETEDWSMKWLDTWVDDDIWNTNFDINIISIDEKTVLIPDENPAYEKTLAKHGVTAIPCRLRHRYFWGHGLNCLTSDILREDECIDYFK